MLVCVVASFTFHTFSHSSPICTMRMERKPDDGRVIALGMC